MDDRCLASSGDDWLEMNQLRHDERVTLGPLDLLRASNAQAHLALVQRAVPRQWLRGERICSEGDPADWLCVIQSGEVEVSIERDGKRLRLAEIGPGRLWGELAFVKGATRTADVVAVSERVNARVLRFDDLQAVRAKSAVLDAVLLQVLHARVDRLTRQLAELSLSVPGHIRLRRHLLELHWQRGEDTIWTTQRALGEAICASRQSVNSWLRADVDAGWIATVSDGTRHGVRVLDADAVELATHSL